MIADVCIAQCMLALSGRRLWLQTSRNQTKSGFIQNPALFAETESAWMQNRIVGRIHMAALSHRSRSDEAAEPKFQIPKTDQNDGEQQSHNWYLKEYYILYYIYNTYCLLRKTEKNERNSAKDWKPCKLPSMKYVLYNGFLELLVLLIRGAYL